MTTKEKIQKHLLKAIKSDFVICSILWQIPTYAMFLLGVCYINFRIIVALLIMASIIELPLYLRYRKWKKQLEAQEFEVENATVERVRIFNLYYRSKSVKFSNKEEYVPMSMHTKWYPSQKVFYVNLGKRKEYYITYDELLQYNDTVQ